MIQQIRSDVDMIMNNPKGCRDGGEDAIYFDPQSRACTVASFYYYFLQVMKFTSICVFLLPLASGFVADTPSRNARLTLDATQGSVNTLNRKDFIKAPSLLTIGLLGFREPALATGRATLEQSYERYAPRIRAGGQFYQGDFKQMVAKGDFKAIKEATEGVPPRSKGDLQVCSFCIKPSLCEVDWISRQGITVVSDCAESRRWSGRPGTQRWTILGRSRTGCWCVQSRSF